MQSVTFTVLLFLPVNTVPDWFLRHGECADLPVPDAQQRVYADRRNADQSVTVPDRGAVYRDAPAVEEAPQDSAPPVTNGLTYVLNVKTTRPYGKP